MTQTATRPLPQWIQERINPLPPLSLRNKPLPEWTATERAVFEPAGMVWNRDRQNWIEG